MLTFKVKHFQELNSTNEFLKKLVKEENVPEGTVILAGFQQKGKGRTDNSWHSKKGKNLLCSILFYPHILVGNHFYLTIFISLAITDALHQLGIEATIKWPNDIYVGNKKLAGILIENTLVGNKVRVSVIGIGMNINQKSFPGSIPNPVSIHVLRGSTFGIDEVLRVILDKCQVRYRQLKEGRLTDLMEAYNSKLFNVDSEIVYTVKGEILHGKLAGVNETGELIIQNERGEELKYLFGEAKICMG